MTPEIAIHVAELIIIALIIPSVKGLVSVVVGLRDATRELTDATKNIREELLDHETRLRWVERNGSYSGPERRMT